MTRLQAKSCESVGRSTLSPFTPKYIPQSPREQLVFDLLRGEKVPKRTFLKDRALFKAVFIKKNPSLAKECRSVLLELLKEISETDTSKLMPEELFHLEMIAFDLIAHLPFLSLEDEKTLLLPYFHKGTCSKVLYQIQRIALTDVRLGSPLVAYGLIGAQKEAPPLLLFKGTTYPQDDGAFLSALTDLNPFLPVGGMGFALGKRNIASWFEKCANNKKAIIVGKSLGGALSWHTALAFPEKIQKVMAFGAPGFYRKDLKRLYRLHHEGKLPEMHFFCQTDDPVTYVNQRAKHGIHYYEVMSDRMRRGVLAHSLMYSLHPRSTMRPLPSDALADRVKRIGMTTLRIAGSFVAFPLLSIVHATNFVIKKICC